MPVAPAADGVTPEELTAQHAALAWFTAEHAVLLGVVARAVDAGFDLTAWQLARALVNFLDARGYWAAWVTLFERVMPAAYRLADRSVEAHTNHILGSAYVRLGRHDDARARYHRALALFAELGDRVSAAFTHRALGWLAERQGDPAAALRSDLRALRLFRGAGHREGEANALNSIGWCHAQLGRYRQAITYCGQALLLHRENGNRNGEASTLDSLGYAYHHLGDHQTAIDHLHRAIELDRELGWQVPEAEALHYLGDAQYAIGAVAAARRAWQQALAIFDRLDRPDAATVRAKLRGRAGTEPPTPEDGAAHART